MAELITWKLKDFPTSFKSIPGNLDRDVVLMRQKLSLLHNHPYAIITDEPQDDIKQPPMDDSDSNIDSNNPKTKKVQRVPKNRKSKS